MGVCVKSTQSWERSSYSAEFLLKYSTTELSTASSASWLGWPVSLIRALETGTALSLAT